MPKRSRLRELSATFTLSADASGMRVNTSGDSIRSPCSLVIGLPSASVIASRAGMIAFHHPSVPGA